MFAQTETKIKFDGYTIEIPGKFKLNLDGNLETNSQCNASAIVDGLLECMLRFASLVLEKSNITEIKWYEKRGKCYPKISYSGKFYIDFCIPTNLEIRRWGLYGGIIGRGVDEEDDNWAFLLAGKWHFYNRVKYNVEEKLLDLALKFKLGLPAHLTNTRIANNSLLFYAPNGDLVLELADDDYKLHYTTMLGELDNSENFLKWLEKTIINAMELELKKYDKSGAEHEIVAGNYTIIYDPNEKMVRDLKYNGNSYEIQIERKRLGVESKDKRMGFYVNFNRNEFFESLGTKLWDIVKYFVF